MTPHDYLMCVWRDTQNSGNLQYAFGAVGAFQAIGRLREDMAELWMRRLRECPEKGEQHVGGRSWCAYCGDVGWHHEDDLYDCGVVHGSPDAVEDCERAARESITVEEALAFAGVRS